ncbi:hypothetical protein HAX54_047398 [Datura stramonium]|uniref:Uncharacterized protein n=1 Tax=Datura stramonium TaxID=4076 RepID=A0ABS8SST2_DATST|nr:hypothetical protein [Datura stramonium]
MKGLAGVKVLVVKGAHGSDDGVGMGVKVLAVKERLVSMGLGSEVGVKRWGRGNWRAMPLMKVALEKLISILTTQFFQGVVNGTHGDQPETTIRCQRSLGLKESREAVKILLNRFIPQ